MNKVHVFLKTPLCAATLPGGERLARDILQVTGTVVEGPLGGGWISLDAVACSDLQGKARPTPFARLSLPVHKIDYVIPAEDEA